jgi:hypothetical protein
MDTKRTFLRSALACAIAISGSYGSGALAVNDEPLTDKWAPSEWGPDDKAGAANRRSAASVLKAMKLVKKGKVATLGKVYQQEAPGFGTRGWRLTIPGLPTGGPFGKQELVYNDEYVATEIGQIGTQFDGPGHIGVITSKGMFFYNGRYLHDKDVSAYGMGPLGVERRAARRPAADPEGEQRCRSGHRHRQGRRGDGQTSGHRADQRGRLRVPAHRARRHLGREEVGQLPC